ncbi:MAG TPA: hypothetical protein VF544_11805 [Pyrinomonadaceae bacterium]
MTNERVKSLFPRIPSIFAVLILLVASTFIGTAQEQRGQQQQPQQEELQLPELAQREPSEALRVAVPRECEGIRPDVQTHDVNDTFNPPGNPVTLSPLLQTFLSGKPVKGYDDKRINMVFADSFKLRSCRVCYATLEFRVKHQPGQWIANAPNFSNDTILAGAAPFTSALRFIGPANIWSATSPNPKLMTLGITPAGLANLNTYLCTGPIPPALDIVAQDDTDFDYVTLRVWYYSG